MNYLRVLMYSNPLVVNKISKQFIYWRDSGFIFSKNLIKSFPDNYRVSWIIPDKIKDHSWFLEANKHIDIIPYPYSTSIHQNRYEFYGEVFRKTFPYTTDIDVIISNQPEVSANLRVWAYNQRRDLPLIYSFFHWIDCDESRSFAKELGGYFWREYDGSLHSDAIYLHKGIGTEIFKREINNRKLDSNSINFREFTPPYTYFGNEPIELPEGKKIILFNHRLNNTTNWRQVLEVCSSLYATRQDFVLWFTDEGRNLRNADMTKKYPFLIVKEVPDESYGYLISKSHFSVCNHRGYSTWNMAVLDAIMNGCFTIVPDDGVYRQMFGDNIRYHNHDDLLLFMDGLLDVDQMVLVRSNGLCQSYVEDELLSPLSSIVDDMESDIKQKLQGTKVPTKFVQVLDMIARSGTPTSKRKWVNKFWSFHVNSNFQKIRWRLLLKGIKDFTKNMETVYHVD